METSEIKDSPESQAVHIENCYSQKFFERDSNGDYIAYLCSNGKASEKDVYVPTALQALKDDRPLFICTDLKQWISDSLANKEKSFIYRVAIKPVDFIRMTSSYDYNELLIYNEEAQNYNYTSILMRLLNHGFDMFVLDPGDENSTQMAFLLNPTKYVRSIEMVPIKNESKLDIAKTQRGFDVITFKDTAGNKCRLQKSSIMDEDRVWLGVADTTAINFVYGRGWEPYPLPKSVMVTTDMHLNQEQVKELIPHLKQFVDTGEIQ